MKNKLLPFSFLLFCFCACNNTAEETPASENDVDAARNFINAALDGDYEKAKTFMLQDSSNLGWLSAAERINGGYSEDEKKKFADASITIHEVNQKVKDSVTTVVYSNSYKKQKDTLKVIRQNGQWLVDLKYLFSHDSDTLSIPLLKTDPITK